jgi:hypothetical protein
MTTRGKSRLSNRFNIMLDAHHDQLPKVAARCHQLGLEMDALEERIVWLEDRTLRRRLARVWQWLVRRGHGGQEDAPG